jgi:pSer/pThr/pTyr-binding forkhead associated (FHA) protein
VWILGGRDAQGHPVRLEFTDALLAGSREGVFIGRSAGHSQLVVNDDSISKQHAQLRKAGAAFLVSDRQSANGTAVNGRLGKPFEEMPLRVGDTLTLGEVKLQFAEA